MLYITRKKHWLHPTNHQILPILPITTLYFRKPIQIITASRSSTLPAVWGCTRRCQVVSRVLPLTPPSRCVGCGMARHLGSWYKSHIAGGYGHLSGWFGFLKAVGTVGGEGTGETFPPLSREAWKVSVRQEYGRQAGRLMDRRMPSLPGRGLPKPRLYWGWLPEGHRVLLALDSP